MSPTPRRRYSRRWYLVTQNIEVHCLTAQPCMVSVTRPWLSAPCEGRAMSPGASCLCRLPWLARSIVRGRDREPPPRAGSKTWFAGSGSRVRLKPPVLAQRLPARSRWMLWVRRPKRLQIERHRLAGFYGERLAECFRAGFESILFLKRAIDYRSLLYPSIAIEPVKR